MKKNRLIHCVAQFAAGASRVFQSPGTFGRSISSLFVAGCLVAGSTLGIQPSLHAASLVLAVDPAPNVTSALAAGGTYGGALAPYLITGDNTPTSYSATGLPTGLAVDPVTGAITGTPTQSGVFNVTIGATNGTGTGTAVLVLTIDKAPLTVTADAQTKVYGAAVPTLTATLSGFVNGEVLATSGVTGSASVTTTATVATPVGNVALTPVVGSLAATNYVFTTFTPGTLAITAARLTVTAAPQTKVYGAAVPTLTATLSGFVNGEVLATSGVTGSASVTTTATAATPVGNATLTPTVGSLAATNYAFTTFTPGTLAITAAPLTVTADPLSIAYGATLPTLTATVSGFVNGEVLATSGVTGSASVTTTATALSPVSTYPLTPTVGTLAATNYAFTTFTPGVLTIGQAALTVTGVTVAAKVYDRTATATATFTGAALSGVAPGDTANVSLVTSAGAAAFADKLVGTAKPVTITNLTLAGTSAANYTLTQPTGLTADITAKPLTVTGVTATSRVYDAGLVAALGTGSAALVGGITGDDVTLVKTAATGAFATKTVGAAKTVQVSGLTLAGVDAANYALTPPTATADITAKNLTVTGVTATSKIYDGNNVATLGFGSVALVGLIGSDVVTPVTGAATGAFASANALVNQVVQVSGLSLAGTDAVNYTVTQPTAVANISPANALVSFTGLSQTYDGKAKAVTVIVKPSAATTVIYSSTGTAPTDAGSYFVTANVSDSNYSGNGSATLVIAKAVQTVALTLTGSSFNVGATVALTATASSGLPVTFSVVSGSAALSGSNLVITAAGPVVVRATQSGNNNYTVATAEQTLNGVAVVKTAQTITFAAPADRFTRDAAFTLAATATSGLPVTFTVVSGPAVLSGGNTVTLSGTAGTVTLRASQAGNATFAAASDVTRTFNVTESGADIFFGELLEDPAPSADAGRAELVTSVGPRAEATKSGDIAAVFNPTTRSGTVIIVAPTLTLNVALDFALKADGTYSVPFTSAGRSLILTGSVAGSTLTGRIATLRVSFSTPVQARTGATAAIAGFYQTSSLNATTGGTTSIVGSGGQILVLATTSSVTTGALGTVAANGAFTVAAPGATIAGAVDATSTAVTGTIAVPNQPIVSFSGIAATTRRTDRLVNLSSRVQVGGGRNLITGFVIGGTTTKQVLVRAIGPALAGFGVTGTLANPRLQLIDASGKIVLDNDDWSGADTAAVCARVGAFALTAGTRDAAQIATLAPGAYTMQILDNGGSGISLAEIYDASANPGADTQRLVNISTRGEAGVGENVLIGGFVVTGNAPKKVLIRGIGPGLTSFGVAGTLTDPRLRVYNGSTLVGENDNWSTVAADATAVAQAATSTGAFTLAAASKDAALILTLAPGSYTAQVGAADGTSTGVGLVEIYELP